MSLFNCFSMSSNTHVYIRGTIRELKGNTSLLCKYLRNGIAEGIKNIIREQ